MPRWVAGLEQECGWSCCRRQRARGCVDRVVGACGRSWLRVLFSPGKQDAGPPAEVEDGELESEKVGERVRVK